MQSSNLHWNSPMQWNPYQSFLWNISKRTSSDWYCSPIVALRIELSASAENKQVLLISIPIKYGKFYILFFLNNILNLPQLYSFAGLPVSAADVELCYLISIGRPPPKMNHLTLDIHYHLPISPGSHSRLPTFALFPAFLCFATSPALKIMPTASRM